MPNAERMRWMTDRRVVEVLEDRGDIHSTPRRVDHWAYFPTAEARQSFVEAALQADFDLESIDDDERCCARVFRTDTVELEHIHAVVMILFELANQHGGDYDGWETSVET
jgi:regulator of RNase E activity RraB